MIQVTNGGAELVVVRGGVTSTYLYSSFKSISWFEANNGNYIVVITFLTDPAGSVPLKLSLNDVDNQGAWTNDVSGSEQAVKDISSWVSLAIAPAAGLATEATLLDVLSAVDSMRDYEVRLVVDASDVTWMEVRYWDAQDGTLGTPVYYLPGSTTPGSPVLPITYINPNTYLAQLVTNTTGLAAEVTLLSVDSNAAQLVTNTTSVTRTPGIATLTGAGLTTAGVYSFSIANIGSASGLVGGESIPAGMTVSFDGGSLNNTLGSISYDATGTTFIITYIS
jgi:hypothetical protein